MKYLRCNQTCVLSLEPMLWADPTAHPRLDLGAFKSDEDKHSWIQAASAQTKY